MDPDSTNQPVAQPTPPPQAATPLASVPTSWPGAFGLYKFSKQAVKLNLGTIVVLWLLTAIVSTPLEIVLRVPGQIISYALTSLIAAAYTITYIAGVRGQRKSISQALSEALPLWLRMIGLTLLVLVSLVVSFVLLVIPVFFVLPRLMLVNYFLVDKKLGVIESYKASWAATKGHAINMWGIIGVNLLMGLLVLTIIGIPFAIYLLIMYSAAFAVVYEFINKARPDTDSAAITPSPPVPDDSPPVPTPSTPTDSLPPASSTPPPSV